MFEDDDPREADPDPWLKHLKSLWAAKDVTKLKEEMCLGFAALEDPLEWLLDVLGYGEMWKRKGQSLGLCLAQELEAWLQKRPVAQPSSLKLKKFQAQVFPILVRCHGNFLDPLIGIYQLHTAERHDLLDQIYHLTQRAKFKEAATLSIKLRLQPSLELEEICVPLLLQDHMDLVEAYVEGYPDLQEQLLRMLDLWFAPNFQIKSFLRNHRSLNHVRPGKVHYRALNKLAFRFLEKHSLDPALCPNVINQRHLGTLKYLMYKRFVEKTMTQENWMDHVQFTLRDNPWLQLKLVQLLVRYGGLEVAAWWALHYGLHGESLPHRVTEAMEGLEKQETLRPDFLEEATEVDEEGRKKDGYYHLPVPREQVFLLSTWEEVEKSKEALLQPGQTVGLDMEWRPSFGSVVGKPRLSLVQLALRGCVFMLDMLQLLGQDRPEKEVAALAAFFRALFADSTITKLGYGMSGDLRSLTQSCPAFRDVDKPLRACLDLLSVHKQLPKCSKGATKGDHEAEASPAQEEMWVQALPERGLSQLVHHILGRPLDKTEQLSNWEKRPLRENQLLYAASDAYCLLEVYAKLSENPAAFGLSPDAMAAPAGKAEAGAKVKKPTARQEAPKSWEPAPEEAAPTAPASIAARDFRVVCDNMLQGLGRYLRCLGSDVRILENEEEHRQAAEIARTDGRVILTSGLPYQTLHSQVGEGRCFRVNSSEKAKDQAFQVLKHFGVRVTLADIFSRCQACNCDQYLRISKEKMAHLRKHGGHLTGDDTATGEQLADGPIRSLKEETLGFDSRQPMCDPHCPWLEAPPLDGDAAALTLPNGRPVRLEAVPPSLLLKEDPTFFYCCSQCGKVFWEGSHYGRLVSHFQEVLDISTGGRSFGEESPKHCARGPTDKRLEDFATKGGSV